MVSSVVSSIISSTTDVTTTQIPPGSRYYVYQSYDPAHSYDPYASNFPNIKNINNAKIPGIEAVNVPFPETAKSDKNINKYNNQQRQQESERQDGSNLYMEDKEEDETSPDSNVTSDQDSNGINLQQTPLQLPSNSRSWDQKATRRKVKLAENDEKRLLDALMWGYDRNVRPVINASHPVVIQLGITLTQIFDMVRK